jgi:CDP-glycerol glycerophosphotransferase (TagB/SpsB family)
VLGWSDEWFAVDRHRTIGIARHDSHIKNDEAVLVSETANNIADLLGVSDVIITDGP